MISSKKLDAKNLEQNFIKSSQNHIMLRHHD